MIKGKAISMDAYDNDILTCPGCGHGNLHQDTVGVYHNRDARTGKEQSVVVSGHSGVAIADVPRAASLNPSNRRDGIRIGFWCEHECDVPDLLIYQVKGLTFVRWDDERKLPPCPQAINEW